LLCRRRSPGGVFSDVHVLYEADGGQAGVAGSTHTQRHPQRQTASAA